MRRYVIDASVLVKLFINEPGSRSASSTVKRAEELLAPDLLWAETGDMLWKYCRRQELQPDEAVEMLDDMLRMPIELFASRDLAPAALEIAAHTDRTIYDSLYLAAAIHSQAILLTADSRFHNSLQSTKYAKHLRLIAVGK